MTILALALGFAVLGGAFALVAPIEGAALSRHDAASLALGVVLFLGCALFGGWLAWSILRDLRAAEPARRAATRLAAHRAADIRSRGDRGGRA